MSTSPLHRLARVSLTAICLLVLSPACSSSPADEVGADAGAEVQTDADDAGAQVTYYQDIKPILDQRCAECHLPGGAGPYPLDTYEHAAQYANLALGAVEAGTMPPWTPTTECRHYADERIMPGEEKQKLRQWVEAGMPEGTPADEPDEGQQSGNDYGEPDIVAKTTGEYTPRADLTDDYHCFLLDATFDQETYMVGSTVMPDDDELVHHADIFVVNPYQVEQVEQLEAENGEPGYPCFGTPGFDSITLLGAWVPGAQPLFLPEDSAAIIPKGARLVLQTHFNTLYTDPRPVRPEFHMWTQQEQPRDRIWAMPFANLNFSVPPGESNSVHTLEFRNRSADTWHVLGAAAHMHLFGEHFRLDIERDDDAGEECLLDIPEWDFDWQQVYRFRDGEMADVNPGDTVRLTCSFDNSPENQPVINGERQQPGQVTWGGKTTDEMCLGFLVVSEPYVPAEEGGGLCGQFKTCRDQCEDPYGIGCLFNCATEELTCGQCLLNTTQQCAFQYCAQETRAATPCILNCAQAAQTGGDVDACLVDNCPDERDALEACLRPQMEGGYCNPYLTECNVEF